MSNRLRSQAHIERIKMYRSGKDSETAFQFIQDEKDHNQNKLIADR